MKRQVFNPYLPFGEYLPDGEPHVFGDRIYIFGSHDQEDGHIYCLLDYVCYSAPLSDLSDWRYEGVIYRRSQDPNGEKQYLWAPDVCRGTDGRYYLYYVLSEETEIAVAVCDTPAGHYEYLGRVHYPNGEILRELIPFDPALLNDDGKIYLYYGFAPAFPIPRLAGREMPGAIVTELEADMLTVKGSPKVIIPSKKYAGGTSFEGHAFFEACSIRKINGKYNLVYSSETHHELCYAWADSPMGEFTYGGVLVSNVDLGIDGNAVPHNCIANNHGGLECVNGQWYVFYHRHTHGTQCSRQGCADKTQLVGKKFTQAKLTSCGLNDGVLRSGEVYSTVIACNLYAEDGGVPLKYGGKVQGQPYITNCGEERYITEFTNGCTATFRYFDLDLSTKIAVRTRGSGGVMKVYGNDALLCTIPLGDCKEAKEFSAPVSVKMTGMTELRFVYEGKGVIDFLSFAL